MSEIGSFINDDLFIKFLRKKCKAKMIAAAEPVINEAMKEIESKLREALGSIIVGSIDSSFDIFRDGRDLRITVFNTRKDV